MPNSFETKDNEVVSFHKNEFDTAVARRLKQALITLQTTLIRYQLLPAPQKGLINNINRQITDWTTWKFVTEAFPVWEGLWQITVRQWIVAKHHSASLSQQSFLSRTQTYFIMLLLCSHLLPSISNSPLAQTVFHFH